MPVFAIVFNRFIQGKSNKYAGNIYANKYHIGWYASGIDVDIPMVIAIDSVVIIIHLLDLSARHYMLYVRYIPR